MSKVFDLFCEIKPRIELGFSMLTLRFEGRSLKEKRIILGGVVLSLILFGSAIYHFYCTFSGVITENLMKTLFVISGLSQPVLKNLTGLIVKKELLSELLTNIQSLYEEAVDDPVLQDIINRNLKKICEFWKLAYKIALFLLICTALAFGISITLEGEESVVIEFPYISKDSLYFTECMNLLAEIILLYVGYGAITSDCSLLYLGLAILASLNIINDFTVAREKDIHEYKDALKIIAKRHLDTIKNLNLFNEIIYMISLAQFITTTMMFLTSFSIIRTYTQDPLPYVVLILVMGELFALCLFGEFIKIKSEELTDCFYLTNWYDLELKDQRDFLLILAMMQRTNCLKAAGMYDINIFTFIKICKVAMSYCVIILAMAEL